MRFDVVPAVAWQLKRGTAAGGARMRGGAVYSAPAVAWQPKRGTAAGQPRMRFTALLLLPGNYNAVLAFGSRACAVARFGRPPAVAWQPKRGTGVREPRMRGGGAFRQRSLLPPLDQSSVLQLGNRACALARRAKPSQLPPCDQYSVLQLGGCECAGLPLSCTCRPTVTAMRHRREVPPRSLLPPGGGQPCSRSYRRGGERERSRKKRLNWQMLPAAPRTRAVCPAPHFWQPSPLPSSPSLQEPANQLCIPRQTDECGSGTKCQEATLWMRLSVCPLGMPLTAAASGLRGLSLPGLPLLAGVGAKRGRWSAYWLWTGAAEAEAGEAKEW
ncbi:uncharacterized protein LOC115353294 [Aquila chrysaetos chrysaetos]|uniref:uncharacterized protein LOC115353294 n=1 Tax=Aquila chrysaetos chrysaetos TaxID=223781 RepID=UPI001B7D2C2B|nr:uncharacterized protein LOC115353294 [Aquila chrysaetos chrysaetos]XP_040974424.1 uncharacterized protein LOC115353294 [Aquila chrysaetos chrysaetos]XP_040974425.1 uncharacterized protein LOC115353294 [Aquila chrysaetos chrysaetos]XP_040974426.1 uncharacterized protein LOC115353294 [Aquila chrysaetos chrysaetos]XP_040974427.1 uncharacterized protein LOC115353294 [Aquila chrysaetos chrysaetos]